jgi:uncharacterized YigZ family protein
MSADVYHTLGGASEGFLREKASKFFAFAFPVRSVEEVEERLAEIGKRFYDARHVCYAYRLGPAGERYRANDAGEPAHSAGDPILGELKSKGVSDALCIVVRYFGGTKLGVGGLIRAYSEVARDALDQNTIVPVLMTRPLSIRFPYHLTSEVNRVLHQLQLKADKSEFGMDCQQTIEVPLSRHAHACEVFAEMGILEA